MCTTSHGSSQSSKRTFNYVRATCVPGYVILATTSNYQATLPPSILIKHLSDTRASKQEVIPSRTNLKRSIYNNYHSPL